MNHGSRIWDADFGDDREGSARLFCSRKLIKAICRELKVSRKVVRKIVRSEAEFRYKRGHQPRPKLGGFTEELEVLLAANERSRRASA